MRDKVLISNAGTISDITVHMGSKTDLSSAISITAATDYMYIGSHYPFTSKYFKSSSGSNISPSVASVDYWDGSTWRPMSGVTDETGLSGTPFSSDGYLSFQTDKQWSWSPDDTSDNGTEAITGLGTVTIYDRFWVRISYSNDISMTLDWVSDVFCSDENLRDISPSVMGATFMDDWESGKTTWEDQRISASDITIAHLQGYRLNNPNLLLDKTELQLPTSYKTLALIYEETGDIDRSNMYSVKFTNLLKQSFSKDTNRDGRDHPSETGLRTKCMVR